MPELLSSNKGFAITGPWRGAFFIESKGVPLALDLGILLSFPSESMSKFYTCWKLAPVMNTRWWGGCCILYYEVYVVFLLLVLSYYSLRFKLSMVILSFFIGLDEVSIIPSIPPSALIFDIFWTPLEHQKWSNRAGEKQTFAILH